MIKLSNFNGIEQWKPKQVVETAKPETTTLKDVWNRYKIAKASKVSGTSQKTVWQQADRCLDYLLQLNQVLDRTPVV